MNLKRALYTTTLAAGIGVAGLLGGGLGTASADPGQPCGGPNAPSCQNGQGRQQGGQPGGQQGGQPGGQQGGQPAMQRNIDQGRQDHQPFNYNGQQVTPMPAGNGAGWGFWFLGQWIQL